MRTDNLGRSVPRLVLLLLLAVPFGATTACSSETDSGSDSGSGQAAAVRTVDGGEAENLIDEGATVIDVRTSEEFGTGHVEDALNIDVQAADFHEQVDTLDRDQTYVVYCRSGSRAGAAAEMMLEMGFTDVVNAGGFADLEAAGVPAD